MRILVIGGGGREHALVWKLAQSERASKIYCAPGNAGISGIAECVDIKATDFKGLIDFVKNNGIDFTVVGPDEPLVLGIVDEFEKEGLAIFGPRKDAAVIEGSKAFSKAFMKKYNIPTAAYETFDNYDKALEYAGRQQLPLVVKADGLALGKGVIICESLSEAESALKEIMLDKRFGASGNKVVIEEFLTGTEISVLAFCDGKTIVPMVAAQDHKRAFDNDEGPNTGGMGTIAPSIHFTCDAEKLCMDTIFKPTMEGLNKENRQFKGILFFGLILCGKDVKVIEYNARFGDPETQVVLPLLETDLLEIMLACGRTELDKADVRWSGKSAACVILASGGYPEKYETGYEINGLDCAYNDKNVLVFHAGTALDNGRTVTSGGRVLGVCGLGGSADDALCRAYERAKEISFINMHYRKDIGKRL